MSDPAPAIEVHALTKRYGEYEAVRGIDITVRRGEVFGLLGPNGAGKTTTVEILEGYRERSGGEVSVLGYDPASRSIELRRRIGIVLQSGGIYSHVTPRELLRHWAGFYPHPRAVEEVLTLAGLQEKADVRSRKLSGGQLRRLDFALALVGDPELMFLDEPTTGFDPAARHAAWETVRGLRDLGKTILLTTHYLDEAQELADRVAIVKDGRVLAIGPPRELGVGGSHYRVAYRDRDGDLVEQQTDDPTRAAQRADRRSAGAGRAAGGAERGTPDARGRLPGADRRCLTHARGADGTRMGDTLTLTWRQYRLERRMFWRNPSAAFFNFVLPLLFLCGGGIILQGNQHDLNLLVPAIAGMSVMSTTFTALAYNIVFLRERGVLKRIRGAPLPAGSYFGGVAANAVTNTALQIAIIVLAGRVFFGIGWPAHWDELIVFVLAGVVCFAALGVAFAHVIPNFESTAAYVNAVFLPVVFISFFVFENKSAPAFLNNIAEALPLKPLIEGLYGAMVTGQGLSDNLDALAVIGLWGVFGLYFAVRGFSWEQSRT